jgi:isopenicillin-N N-acyltransferase like protein
MIANTMRPIRYPELEVAGSPREMGRAIGEALRDTIRAFSAVAIERVNKTTPVSRAEALRVAEATLPLAEEYAPDSVDELRGIADGSGLSLVEIALLQCRNQLLAQPTEGCTSISLAPPYCETPLLAQNWDADPALDDFTVVLTRRPTGKPAFTTLTQAGMIAYIGMAETGLGVCLNSLPALTRPAPAGRFQPPLSGAWGVPHYYTVRAIYESRSLDEAAAAVRRATRAIPASLMLCTPQGPANLEVTVGEVRVLEWSATGIGIHTNHCCHPALVPINADFPELIQSHDRFARVHALVADRPGPLTRAGGVGLLQSILRDKDGFPTSICRHANDRHPQHGFWESVFSVIMDPAAREMWITRGPPDMAPYERYRTA